MFLANGNCDCGELLTVAFSISVQPHFLFASGGVVFKNFQDFPSHRMFGHMHRALNIDEKKPITQFGTKS
jgi:hypothetical protein